MAGIRMGGLASGLDTAKIISDLMAVERNPRARIELDQVAAQSRKDALADIQTKLKTLKTASADLKSTLTWTKAQQVTSSEPNRISAKVTGEVDPRTFDITVQRLAVTAERRFDFAGGGTLEFTPTSTGVTTSIDLSTATTVDEAVSLINQAGAGVGAKNVNGQLQLLSTTKGGDGNFTATGTGLTEKSSKTGVDAQFTVDGVAKTASSNVIADAIPGVEVELRGLTPVDPVAISATPTGIDKTKVKDEIKQFVDAYNSALDAMRSKTTEQRVRNPETTFDARKGVLHADGGLRQIISSLRNATMNDLGGTGNAVSLDNLVEIGISTGKASGGTSTAESLAGKLVIDDAKLTKALEDDPLSVERLFTGDNGFATRMETILTPLLETDGTFDGRLVASDSELKGLKKSLETMDQRLTRKEEQYRRQFTALETAMSRAQSQQASMASALAGLPRYS